ncbi:MAG: FKBP-type peptidyl-prolyl cis-trans isomerase [Caldilineaceae bacterium]
MPGWNTGVLGMRSAGRRLLWVQPGLAFGQRGVSGVVPANAIIEVTDPVGFGGKVS